jgi:hypothetical protein
MSDQLWAERVVPCVECEERPGEPERFGRCLSCDYDYPPPIPCEKCGTHSWAMEEGWYCTRCYPDGPWVPGFGPDDDRPRDPRMVLQIKAVAAQALAIPADDVSLQ